MIVTLVRDVASPASAGGLRDAEPVRATYVDVPEPARWELGAKPSVSPLTRFASFDCPSRGSMPEPAARGLTSVSQPPP